MRVILKLVDTEKRRLFSIMWVGLIQVAEDLNRTKTELS